MEERRARRQHKKRSRPREEEHLDEEDLELIGEHVPGLQRGPVPEVCRRYSLWSQLLTLTRYSPNSSV